MNEWQTWVLVGTVLALAAAVAAVLPVLVHRQFATVHAHLDALDRLVDKLDRTLRRLQGDDTE